MCWRACSSQKWYSRGLPFSMSVMWYVAGLAHFWHFSRIPVPPRAPAKSARPGPAGRPPTDDSIVLRPGGVSSNTPRRDPTAHLARASSRRLRSTRAHPSNRKPFMPRYLPDFAEFSRLADEARLRRRERPRLVPVYRELVGRRPHAGLGLRPDRRGRRAVVPLRERHRRREGRPVQLPRRGAVPPFEARGREVRPGPRAAPRVRR